MATRYDFDLGLRHKPGMTSDEFIRRYCEVFREFAHATRDDSLNEFEKLITHVLNMYCYNKKRSELLGMKSDPRGDVAAIEDAEQAVRDARIKLAATLYAARGDLPDYDARTAPDNRSDEDGTVNNLG